MLLFLLGLNFILIHEMDAIRCKEWRIFPGLSLLKEPFAFQLFMLAHIPLFYFIFQELFSNPSTSLRWGLDIFLVIHVFLHILAYFHPRNEFKDFLSWFIILGAGTFGLLDLFWGT